jgi:hypothetical protein
VKLLANAPTPQHGYLNSPTESLPKGCLIPRPDHQAMGDAGDGKNEFGKIISDANIKIERISKQTSVHNAVVPMRSGTLRPRFELEHTQLSGSSGVTGLEKA